MMIIAEYICYCLIPSAVLCLWIVGIVTLIRSLVKKKDQPYSKNEKLRCALDILFLMALWAAGGLAEYPPECDESNRKSDRAVVHMEHCNIHQQAKRWCIRQIPSG